MVDDDFYELGHHSHDKAISDSDASASGDEESKVLSYHQLLQSAVSEISVSDPKNDKITPPKPQQLSPRDAKEEELLKSGEYAFLTRSGDFFEGKLKFNKQGHKTYKKNLANGDSEDLALWRVLRTLGKRGFSNKCFYPTMVIIQKEYTKWVWWQHDGGRNIDPCALDWTEDDGKFIFEWNEVVVDLATELLEERGSITKEEFLKITEDIKKVKLIKWS